MRVSSLSLKCAAHGLIALAASLVALPFEARAGSVEEYSAGNYSGVIPEVRRELTLGLKSSQEFIARIRLATNSFAQQSGVSLEELLSVYDAGVAQAKTYRYDQRMTTERAEVSRWLAREQKIAPSEALAAVNEAVKWPEVSIEELTKKSSRLFALALLARRRILSESVDPEWYFVAGKALDADTGSGEAFLELYLEQPDSKNASHRSEAVATVERVYQRRYEGAIPAELRLKLKRWKSAVPVPAKKKPSSR